MIGGIINGLTQSIMAAKKFKNYGDLRGATFGAISLTSGVTFALRQVLKVRTRIPAGLQTPRYRWFPANLCGLTTGQIDAAALSLPLNYAAEEQGFNEIGRFVDVIPNYQLAALSVKRSWGDKNRALLVRFMKSMAQTYRWIYQNKEAAVDFLAQEMKLKRDHARRGWEFYTGTICGIRTETSTSMASRSLPRFTPSRPKRRGPCLKQRSTWTKVFSERR